MERKGEKEWDEIIRIGKWFLQECRARCVQDCVGCAGLVRGLAVGDDPARGALGWAEGGLLHSTRDAK